MPKKAEKAEKKVVAKDCRCGKSLETGEVEFQGEKFCDRECPAYAWQVKHPNEKPA